MKPGDFLIWPSLFRTKNAKEPTRAAYFLSQHQPPFIFPLIKTIDEKETASTFPVAQLNHGPSSVWSNLPLNYTKFYNA